MGLKQCQFKKFVRPPNCYMVNNMYNKQEMIDRYYEFQRLINHSEYTLNNDELMEYQELCAELLYVIMKDNKDVLERLKDR